MTPVVKVRMVKSGHKTRCYDYKVYAERTLPRLAWLNLVRTPIVKVKIAKSGKDVLVKARIT